MWMTAILVTWSATAKSEPRARGELIVGAERMFGFSYVKETWTDDTNSEIETTGTSFSILMNSSVAGPISLVAPLVYSSPRVAVDYLPIDGLTVGGVLGLARVSLDTTLAGASEETSGSMVVFGPRAGYAHMFSPTFGIWPRGGFTYFSLGSESDDGEVTEVSVSGASLDIDGLLLLMPAPNLAFTVGPSLNLGLSGSAQYDDTSGRTEFELGLTQFGIQGGLSVLL
jgi:hypothetical protein